MKVPLASFPSLVFILVFFVSCNNVQEQRQEEDTSRLSPPEVENPVHATDSISGCYMKVSGRDTLFLQLASSTENVTGKIWFDNYQYDGSSGNLHGKLYNDTLRLLYNFEAEGMKNVSELIFKVEDQSLIRADGEIAVKGDTSYFANPGKINFPEASRLKKVDCSGWNRNR